MQTLLQKGATILNPASRYLKLVWTNVDTGSNVHIANNIDTLFQKKNVSNMTSGQASGSKAKVKCIGSFSCIFGKTHLQTKPKYTLGMFQNPTSTISTYALKKFDGFIRANHESNLFLRTIDKDGNEFWFTPENGLLKVINGLDYVPIIHPVDHPPITKQATF